MSDIRGYSYSIASAEKTMRLIEILSQSNSSMSVSEIASILDTHTSSADRYLLTLQDMGYVEKDSAGRFVLSDKMLYTNNSIIAKHPLTARYLDIMHTLAYEFDTTTHIMSFFGCSTIVLHKDLQTHNMSFNNAFFDPTRYYYCSAPGKLMLSTLSEKELQAYFRETKFIRFNKKTLSSEAAVREDLERIRRRGYSIHDEEWLSGNLTLSFPLRVNGEIKGAMSLMCDIDRKAEMLSQQTIERIKNMLVEPQTK